MLCTHKNIRKLQHQLSQSSSSQRLNQILTMPTTLCISNQRNWVVRSFPNLDSYLAQYELYTSHHSESTIQMIHN